MVPKVPSTIDLAGYELPIDTIGTSYLYELPNQSEDASQSRFFRTTRSLRGSRVWEAIEVKSREEPTPLPNARPVVLKDAWIDSSRLTEKAIQTQLFGDIRAFAAKRDWREHPLLLKFDEGQKDMLGDLFEGDKFENLFLRVSLEYKGPAKATHEDEDRIYDAPFRIKRRGDSSTRTESSKNRVITVFGEVCTALGDLPTLGEATDILNQSVVALQLMMLAGWVHHDISPGNILAFRKKEDVPWRVKLADLEYARRCSNDSNDRLIPPIGTAPFMPCEIRAQRRVMWTFLTRANLIYDFQHDLESIWWIWLWLITSRLNDSGRSQEAYRHVFINSLDEDTGHARKVIWGGFCDYSTSSHTKLGDVFSIIDNLRAKLLDLCCQNKDTSNSVEDNYERYSAAHALFQESFRSLKAIDNTWESLALLKRRKFEAHGEGQFGSQENAPQVHSSCDIRRTGTKHQKAQRTTAASKNKMPMKTADEPPTVMRATRSLTKRKLDEESPKAVDATGPRMTRSKTRLARSEITEGSSSRALPTKLKTSGPLKSSTRTSTMKRHPTGDDGKKRARYAR
ncbi:hypothetical protein D9611_008111 [Ephemerocybe angulata]|uniref:Protein kinase domain-containing protein n=1 Tax=Ephemerocybe angulata TaxID=980116 RepID=A0A8H5BZ00_9AGAR|nr:hypothetical protein D9611_008111 [Tulosesus angulatus]